MIEEKWLTARGVFGFFPAARRGDDIELYTDDDAHRASWPRCTTCASRASTATACRTGRWPTSWRPVETGLADHVGAFAVTAGIGLPEPDRGRSRTAHDDYSAILLESLADRLAEAFAERLHERVRTELWGYAAATSSWTTRS